MALPSLQILATAFLLAYAAFWYWQQQKRRKRTWHEIVAQLRGHDWGIEEIAEGFLYKQGIRATEGDIWPKIAGCQGLWSMYKNAPVLIQLADYAAEHGDSVDSEMLRVLRSDAFQIRLHVMSALAQHALSSSSPGALKNAYEAASAYCNLLARMTEFIQEHSARYFPSYLDAVA